MFPCYCNSKKLQKLAFTFTITNKRATISRQVQRSGNYQLKYDQKLRMQYSTDRDVGKE